MLKPVMLLIFILHLGCLAQAEVTVDNNQPPADAPTVDFVDSCVRVCTNVAQRDTAALRATFRRNCQAARRDADEISTLIGATKRTGNLMAQFTYRCAPQAIAKAATGLWEAVSSLPGWIVSVFTTDPITRAEREAREKFMKECSELPDCMRGLARQLTRFQDKDANGQYQVSDADVDAYIGKRPYRAIAYEVQGEINRLSSHCNTQLVFHSTAAHSLFHGQSSLVIQREIYNRLAADSPYCPQILKMTPPELDAAHISIPPPGTPLDRLTFSQKLAVGYGCLGDEFTEVMWDACSEGLQYMVPVPVGAVAAAGARGAARLGRFLPTSDRMRRLMAELPAGHEAISQVAGGILTRTVAADGKVSYQVVRPGGVIDRQRMDASGYALSASNEAARQMAYAELASGGRSVMFFDVNHLGLVNYYRNGAQAGDEYLGNVARILQEQVGPNGTVYRWGGDEFIVVYNSTDRAAVTDFTQKVSDTIIRDPSTRALFRAEKEANAATFRAVTTASSYESLPTSFVSSLSEAERAFAQNHFPEFKTIFRSVEAQRIRDSAAIQPSVSVGSAVYGSGGTAQETIGLANQGANICKIGYKSAVGLNVCKYTGREAYLPVQAVESTPRDLRATPQATPTY